MIKKIANQDVKPRQKKIRNHIPEPLNFIVFKKPLNRRKIVYQIASFALMSLLVAGLIQGAIYLSSAKNASGEILGAATTAYENFDDASKNLSRQNLTAATELFASAQHNVKLAQEKLNDYKPLTWIAPQAASADHILAGASHLAAAGTKLSSALKIFEELKINREGVDSDFEKKLEANRQALEEIRNQVYKAGDEFEQAGSAPLDYEGTLQKAKDQVFQLGAVLDKMVGLEDLYLGIFSGDKTYLLIFQNYDEQRATGGFIGTYGVLKAKKGSIDKLQIDSIYDLDSKITNFIAAPGPFQPDIKRWGIRDANWFADFPVSAKKLLSFFENGQETADGVISMTPKVFEDLLRLVGPIEMKGYGVTLTPENFQDVVQYKTSVDYDKVENEPKKMLADFAPLLLDRLSGLPQERWLELFQVMQDNLSQRNIMIYSKDSAVQNVIERLGFDGGVLSTDHDYLMIVNSNLGGTKTDLEMKQRVELKSKILSDGSILNSLVIDRTNGSPTYNKNYMRLLVPYGSELVSAVGFDDHAYFPSTSEGLRTDFDLAAWDKGRLWGDVFIRSEAGKTEFGGWITTQAGESKSVTVTYMLPFKAGGVHSLYLQKQAGSKPYEFVGQFSGGKNNVEWSSAGVEKNGNTYSFKSSSNTDNFWGFILK